MELLAGFLGFLSALILLGLGAWIGYDIFSARREHRGEIRRRSEVTERWLMQTRANPADPAAWSRLGDAYRHDDLPEEAIEAWTRAIETARTASVAVIEDWPHKIRMAEKDIAERGREQWNSVEVARREQPCRSCGAIAAAGQCECVVCGYPLPVDSIDQVVRHPLLRRALATETLPVLARWAAAIFAILIATWLPMEIRAVLTIAAVAVLPFWWLRRFGNGG